MKKVLVTAVLAASTALPSPISTANAQTISSNSSTTNYHTVTVDGLKIFYQEAGPKDAPTILLLHGYARLTIPSCQHHPSPSCH